MPNIDVCLSPETIHLFDLKGKVVIVTDIFRATSTMTTALAHGIASIIPVSAIKECENYSGSEYIMAAERGGKKLEGFKYGNSPFDYMSTDTKDKTLIMTTTNGTRALNLSTEADVVLIGSFLNLSATIHYVMNLKKDIVVFCAGWKGRYSLEDSLYAGAVVSLLKSDFNVDSDSSFSQELMFQEAEKQGLFDFVSNAAHFRRLNSFSNHEDIKFCMKIDEFNLVGKLVDNQIVAVKNDE